MIVKVFFKEVNSLKNKNLCIQIDKILKEAVLSGVTFNFNIIKSKDVKEFESSIKVKVKSYPFAIIKNNYYYTNITNEISKHIKSDVNNTEEEDIETHISKYLMEGAKFTMEGDTKKLSFEDENSGSMDKKDIESKMNMFAKNREDILNIKSVGVLDNHIQSIKQQNEERNNEQADQSFHKQIHHQNNQPNNIIDPINNLRKNISYSGADKDIDMLAILMDKTPE